MKGRPFGRGVDLRESSAKGVAKVNVLFAKVLCKGGLLTGSWSDESCVFTGSARAECLQTKVGRGMRSLSVAAEHAAAKATPGQKAPACRSF